MCAMLTVCIDSPIPPKNNSKTLVILSLKFIGRGNNETITLCEVPTFIFTQVNNKTCKKVFKEQEMKRITRTEKVLEMLVR